MNKIRQAFQDSAKWLLFCAILLCNFNLSQAQNDHGSRVEIAIYRAAVQAVFSDTTILAHSYFLGSKPRNRDFFILVPQNIKAQLSFGRRQDKFVADSSVLYKRVRKATRPYLVLILIQQVPNKTPSQFGVHFVIDGLARVNKHQLERRLVTAPLISKDEDYFLGFEAIEEDNGNIVVRRYPLPYIPLTPK